MARPKSLPYEAPETETPYSVELHSTAGGSDKIYRLSVERSGDGWKANFANGRRGGTLKPGTKTPVPVSYPEARKACNDTLYAKVGDGYVPIGGSLFGEGMQAEAIATLAKQASGHVPQLLGVLDGDGLEALLRDDRYVAQRKHNGDRRIVIVQDGVATGANRRGETVALSSKLREAVSSYPDVVLDGEQIGDAFHVWDIVSYKGIDLRGRPLEHRQAALEAGGFERPGLVSLTETVRGEEAKRRLLAEYQAAKGEGLVFKLLGSPYEPGKPGGKATWHKFKFWNSLSAVVEGTKKGRSVHLHLLDEDGAKVPVGGVTVPANHPLPAPGSVVEIRYMYAFEGGGLHQPVYLGERTDILPGECLATQRVFVDAPDEATAPAPGM